MTSNTFTIGDIVRFGKHGEPMRVTVAPTKKELQAARVNWERLHSKHLDANNKLIHALQDSDRTAKKFGPELVKKRLDKLAEKKGITADYSMEALHKFKQMSLRRVGIIPMDRDKAIVQYYNPGDLVLDKFLTASNRAVLKDRERLTSD